MSFIEDAKSELRRSDHLIFVSLKYTRMADVLTNILKRFISCYDFIIEGLLVKKEMEGELESIPTSPVIRVRTINELYNDDILKEGLERYLLFRRLIFSKFRAENEYRRHVAMIVNVDGKEFSVNIDNISEFYAELKEFVRYVEETYDLDFENE